VKRQRLFFGLTTLFVMVFVTSLHAATTTLTSTLDGGTVGATVALIASGLALLTGRRDRRDLE